MRHVLALDIGASSGRFLLGRFDGKIIQTKEIHRFQNESVFLGTVLYWDFLMLMREIYTGLQKAKDYPCESLGIDSFGVDFGLLDAGGHLLENPVCYRDARTDGILAHAFARMEEKKLYQKTGIAPMQINSLFQLFSLAKERKDLLSRAHNLLFIPDLISYFLTGEIYAEESIASTSQMVDIADRFSWSDEILRTFHLPKHILPPIIAAGNKVGRIKEDVCKRLGIKGMDVIAVCGHDTQSAMLAVPSEEEEFIFISCGTWSLIGSETGAKIAGEAARKKGFSNENGHGGKTSFLKNLTGLWLLQECKKDFEKDGKTYSYETLCGLAEKAEENRAYIDVAEPCFAKPGAMPEKINAYLAKSGQAGIHTISGFVRCILESLALKYKDTVTDIEALTGKQYRLIHLLGGGANNAALCQYCASACQKTVLAGPTEATALGNIASQLIALHALKDVKEARSIIRNSEKIKAYSPKDSALWEEKYHRYKTIIQRGKTQ